MSLCFDSWPPGGDIKSKQAAPRVRTDHWQQDHSYTLYRHIAAAQIPVRAAPCFNITK